MVLNSYVILQPYTVESGNKDIQRTVKNCPDFLGDTNSQAHYHGQNKSTESGTVADINVQGVPILKWSQRQVSLYYIMSSSRT